MNLFVWIQAKRFWFCHMHVFRKTILAKQVSILLSLNKTEQRCSCCEFFPSVAHFQALCMNGDVYRRDWMYLLMFTENYLQAFLKTGCCLNFIHHSKESYSHTLENVFHLRSETFFRGKFSMTTYLLGSLEHTLWTCMENTGCPGKEEDHSDGVEMEPNDSDHDEEKDHNFDI